MHLAVPTVLVTLLAAASVADAAKVRLDRAEASGTTVTVTGAIDLEGAAAGSAIIGVGEPGGGIAGYGGPQVSGSGWIPVSVSTKVASPDADVIVYLGVDAGSGGPVYSEPTTVRTASPPPAVAPTTQGPMLLGAKPPPANPGQRVLGPMAGTAGRLGAVALWQPGLTGHVIAYRRQRAMRPFAATCARRCRISVTGELRTPPNMVGSPQRRVALRGTLVIRSGGTKALKLVLPDLATGQYESRLELRTGRVRRVLRQTVFVALSRPATSAVSGSSSG